ncbi:MAG: hypothetical protein ACPG4U_15835 [Pseudomonadales bacterium]
MGVQYGEIESWIRGRVLYLSYRGAIKEKTYRSGAVKARQLAESLGVQVPWVVCHDLSAYEGHVPEAEPHVESFRRWRAPRNCIGEAYILGDSLLRKSMAENLLSRQQVNFKHRYFATLACAQDWLNRDVLPCLDKTDKQAPRP